MDNLLSSVKHIALKQWQIYIFILVIQLLSSATYAMEQDSNEINWFVQDWPPYHFIRGDNKREGVNDKIISYIHQKLPEYQIKWVNMSTQILEESMERGDKVCRIDLFKTAEREKFIYFSKNPTSIDLSLRVFVHEKTYQKKGYKNSVSLNELLNDKSMDGFFIHSRSYGNSLDTIIHSHAYKDDKLVKQSSSKSQIKRFMKGRLDYIVEYSPVVTYYAQEFKSKAPIRSIAIDETPEFVLSYLGCTKNAWGKSVVDKIDTILNDALQDSEYRALLEQWHSPSNAEILRQYYSELK